MIVFQVFIKFWSSERNTENTMSHLYLNEESDHSEENTCKNEVFWSSILHHRKKLNIRLSCRYITCSIRIGNLDWYKCQEQPLGVFCEKKCSIKFRKIYRKHLCQTKKPVNFVRFFRAPFLNNNSGRLFLKCRHCKN